MDANDKAEVNFLSEFPPEIANINAQPIADFMTDSFNDRVKRRDLGTTPYIMKKRQVILSEQKILEDEPIFIDSEETAKLLDAAYKKLKAWIEKPLKIKQE